MPAHRRAAGFPKCLRLLSAGQFRRVFQQNVRSSDRCFVVLARTADGSRARLGLAIGRKAAARAVDRNRLKRLIRESFRLQGEQLPALDFVVTARPGARVATNEEVRAALARHWQRVATASGV